jgi:PPM family protein phosphatase
VLRVFGATDKGRIRPTNEDHFAVDEPLGLVVVADGMGGHNAGEVAARVAVDVIVERVRSRDAEPAEWPFGLDPALSMGGNLLRTAIYQANQRVLETSAFGLEYAGMGTTVVAALVSDGRLAIGHVGDSRLYVLGSEGLRQLTADDSWLAAVQAEKPHVDPVALRCHPMRNALTSVIGRRLQASVHVTEQRLIGGELLLLSTDGVHGVLDRAPLERLLRHGGDVRQMATAVVAAAIAHGSPDNCTAVVARYFSD